MKILEIFKKSRPLGRISGERADEGQFQCINRTLIDKKELFFKKLKSQALWTFDE